jgi:septal ring factor EnvC (AmiA/AmiB activator)
MEEIKMINIIMVISAFITAMATLAIAFLTKTNLSLTKSTLALAQATHELNKTIKASSDQHQQNMEKLQIDLAAAQLYAATNPPGKSMNTQTLDDFRRLVTKSL